MQTSKQVATYYGLVDHVSSCAFIELSAVFDNLGLAREAFEASEPTFTWGNCDRSLVPASAILEHVKKIDRGAGAKSKGFQPLEEVEMKELESRLSSLGELYVDFEN